LKNSKNTKASISKSETEERMLIENEIAYIIGELNKYQRDSCEYKELDGKFQRLIIRKRELNTLNWRGRN
jgi:macrolide transport system ATP-binding/permease protein